MNELKEITKVDKELLDKIEHILASELNCEEYDTFYNYFNEIRKPNILIDIKDNENIKELITNLQSKIDKAIEFVESMKYCGYEDYFYDNKTNDPCGNDNTFNDSKNKLLDILKENK